MSDPLLTSIGAVITIQIPGQDHLWGETIGTGVARNLHQDEVDIALPDDFQLPPKPILVSLWQEQRYLGCAMLGPDGFSRPGD